MNASGVFASIQIPAILENNMIILFPHLNPAWPPKEVTKTLLKPSC